jgi:uncharacterized protein (UPF0333 family)
MGVFLMDIKEDERAQTSAEMILLFGGIIVIAIVALLVYENYTKGLANATNSTANNVTNSINNLTTKFN